MSERTFPKWDPDLQSYVFNGTTDALMFPDDFIGAIKDQSGHGREAVQQDESKQPTHGVIKPPEPLPPDFYIENPDLLD